MTTVGYIGLGAIGAPVARRILGAGYKVVVWNRTRERTRMLEAEGACVADTPAALAQRCDVIFTCLLNSAAHEEVLFGDHGVAVAAPRAKVLVDNSTIAPATTRQFAGSLQDKSGIEWVDAPVSGGPRGAESGTLAVFVGGESASVARVRPIIESCGRRVTHLGPVGSGQVAKACNQLINFVSVSAIAEALALSAAAGIDVEQLPAALEGGFADTPLLREYARGLKDPQLSGVALQISAFVRFLQGEICPAPPGSLARILLKDLHIVQQLGRSHDAALPVTNLVTSLFELMDGKSRASSRN